MKLVRREVKVDPVTYAYLVELTVHVPIETVQDGTITKDELAAVIGAELIEYLTQPPLAYQLAQKT